jgi:hypothetical protein
MLMLASYRLGGDGATFQPAATPSQSFSTTRVCINTSFVVVFVVSSLSSACIDILPFHPRGAEFSTRWIFKVLGSFAQVEGPCNAGPSPSIIRH